MQWQPPALSLYWNAIPLNMQINLTYIFLFRAHSTQKQIASNYAIDFMSIRLLFILILLQKAINRYGSLPFPPWPSTMAHNSSTYASWSSNLDAGQLSSSHQLGKVWWAWDGLVSMGWAGEHTACGMTSLAILQERSSHWAIPLTHISPGQFSQETHR